MKNIYVRSKNSIAQMSLIYFISLLPLIGYGFYKNGIFLYLKGYVNLLGMFKPLIFMLIGIFSGALVNIIYEKGVKKSKESLKEVLFSSFHIIYGLLIASLTSINTNIFLYTVLTFSLLLLSKFVKMKNLNVVALTSLLMILLTYLFSAFSYSNIYERSNVFNLNAVDYLFGRGIGGINTTCIALLVISLIILWNSHIYKKEIPLYSIISFFILILGYCIYKNDIANIFNMLFTNSILFSFVFVATIPNSSSYTKIGKIIYGIFVGILAFIFYLINPSFASLGAILIAGILSSVIDIKFE